LPYPATTPLLLARYLVVPSGQVLRQRFAGTAEIHCVLGERAATSYDGDRIRWGVGDCLCLPGGAATAHEAEEDALLLSVTNEAEVAYRDTSPTEDVRCVPLDRSGKSV
jgi:gentisate 1,2-dioxygenase